MFRNLLFILSVAASPMAAAQEGGGHQHHQHMEHAEPSWPAGSDADRLLTAEFELVNGRNKVVTEQDFRGRYLLVGFGFSHCAHVCPTILRDWAAAVELLPHDKAGHLWAVMISLDPDRDSPEHMDRYVRLFNPDFHGLSGSPEQVARAAENFRVTYQKVPVGDDYQINHTSMTYLVDPRGEVIDYYGFGTPSQQLAASIAGHIRLSP